MFQCEKETFDCFKKTNKNIKIEGEKYDRRIKSAAHGCKADKKEKLIADFILDNFAEACFITSTEIAKRIHVSDSSGHPLYQNAGLQRLHGISEGNPQGIYRADEQRFRSYHHSLGAAQAEHFQAGSE